MEEEKNNRERTVYKKVKDKYVFFIIIHYRNDVSLFLLSKCTVTFCSVRGCPLSARRCRYRMGCRIVHLHVYNIIVE